MSENKGTLNLIFRTPPTRLAVKGDKRWVICNKCKTKQFRLAPIATIRGMVWKCRNPECGHDMVINVR